MIASTLDSHAPATPTSLSEAIDNWVAELLSARFTVDQLSPWDVLSGLQDIRIDTRRTARQLPKPLQHLLTQAKTRIKEMERGEQAVNFNLSSLLRTADNAAKLA